MDSNSYEVKLDTLFSEALHIVDWLVCGILRISLCIPFHAKSSTVTELHFVKFHFVVFEQYQLLFVFSFQYFRFHPIVFCSSLKAENRSSVTKRTYLKLPVFVEIYAGQQSTSIVLTLFHPCAILLDSVAVF